MKVSFAPIDEAYLRNKVEQGYYSSISEAIRDAVRKLREMEQSRLIYALEAAEQDIQSGQIEPLEKDMFDNLVEEGIEQAALGRSIIRSDVQP